MHPRPLTLPSPPMGRGTRVKGERQGETTGKIQPLFVLKKEVKIKSRVHPEVILAWEKPRMIAAFRAAGVRLTG